MTHQAIARLVEQAKQDPQFFYDLVFNTQRVLVNLDYLDQNSKSALATLNPEEVIATMISEPGCGGSTCGGNTCGSDTCGVTCASSCDRTCDNSCGYTTNFEDRFRFDPGVFRSNPSFFRRIS